MNDGVAPGEAGRDRTSDVQVMRLSADLVARTARAHHAHFDPQEFSVVCGPGVISRFYELVAESETATAFVVLRQSEVVASVCAFRDYDAFHRKLARRMLPGILLRILSDPFLILEVLRQARVRNPLDRRHRRFHIGALFVRSEPVDLGVLNGFGQAYREAVDWLRQGGAGTIWISTRTDNTAAMRFFRNRGFGVVGESQGVTFMQITPIA